MRRVKPTSASPPGKKKGHLFIRGKIVRVVPEEGMVQALVEEAERLVAEGAEARIAAADAGAEAEAEADRRELLGEYRRRPEPHVGEDRGHPPPRLVVLNPRAEAVRTAAVPSPVEGRPGPQ